MPPDEEWHVLLLLLNQLPHAYHWQMPSWISNGLLASLCYHLPSLHPWSRWMECLSMRVTEAFKVKTTIRNSHMYTLILDKCLSLLHSLILAHNGCSVAWFKTSWITLHICKTLASLFVCFFAYLGFFHISSICTPPGICFFWFPVFVQRKPTNMLHCLPVP